MCAGVPKPQRQPDKPYPETQRCPHKDRNKAKFSLPMYLFCRVAFFNPGGCRWVGTACCLLPDHLSMFPFVVDLLLCCLSASRLQILIVPCGLLVFFSSSFLPCARPQGTAHAMPLHARGLRGLTPALIFHLLQPIFGMAPSPPFSPQQSAGKRAIDIFGCNATQTRALALAYL